MKRLILMTCCTGVLVLTVAACIGNARVQPSANDFLLTAEAKLPAPTFTAGEPFNCWTVPAPKTAARDNHSKGKLLLVFSVIREDLLSLYQFDLATQKYSLLASPIDALPESPISPDGNYLAYQRRTDPVGFIAYIYSFAESTTRQVPVLVGESGDWSPDGRCLLIWRDQNIAFAYRLVDGALQKRSWPTESGQLIGEFSPNGKWRAWSCEKSVCLIGPDGQRIDDSLHLPIATQPRSGYYNTSFIWWSPDSHMLAIVYPKYDWQYRDGLRLIHLDENGVSSQDVAAQGQKKIDDVHWSPDSNELLIMYWPEESLNIFNLSTGKAIPLSSPNGYSSAVGSSGWSPDGKQIVFVAQDRHTAYTMNVDGTNIAPIPSLPPDAPGADALAPDFRIDRVLWVP